MIKSLISLLKCWFIRLVILPLLAGSVLTVCLLLMIVNVFKQEPTRIPVWKETKELLMDVWVSAEFN